MATITDSLRGLSSYPAPLQTIMDIAAGRGLNPSDDTDSYILQSRAYKLASADLYRWLAVSPNVIQGGQNYSWNTEQRKYLLTLSDSIYAQYGDEDNPTPKSNYGYKGDRL